MTDTSPSTQSRRYAEPTGWVGWIIFAAFMLVTVGVLHVIQGFVALFKDSYFVVASSGLVLSVDYTTWGWVHLIFGVLIALAGMALFSGRMWARIVGIAFALLSALINFTFIAAYPIWSLIVIAVDVLVVYALIVHGREMRDTY